MESIFLILSGVILVAGVLYWLWSHIQLTQKKVQLLENAVFELRGMLANSGGGSQGPGVPELIGGGGGGGGPSSPTRQVQVTPASAAVAAMLSSQGGSGPVGVDRMTADDADADAENGWDGSERRSMPLDAPVLETSDLDELRPGGNTLPASLQAALEETDTPVRASAVIEKLESAEASEAVEIDLDVSVAKEDASAEQFRNLFTVQDKSAPLTPPAAAAAPAAADAKAVAESLESMPVKELRRLAEQRGIAGAADMRKKEILAALRQQVSMTLSEDAPAPAPAPAAEAEADSDIREVAIDSAEILE